MRKKNNSMNTNKYFTSIFALIFLLINNAGHLYSQELYPTNAIIKKNQDTLYNAMDGGMNSPQFAQFDLNNDGLDELLMFDRVGKVFNVYEYNITKKRYQYMIDPPIKFPKLEAWVVMKDYNGDGILDILALPNEGPFGFGVWKGRKSGNITVFDHLNLNQGFYNLLYYPGNNGKLQVYCANTDIPCMDDIDGDGDLDIFTFNEGGAYLEFYKNMSAEKGFGRDSLIFEKKDLCYGKFFENSTTNQINLSSNPNSCPNSFDDNPLEVRHSGSTTLIKDIDKDGIKDILIGDLSYNNVIYLRNTGSNLQAFITDTVEHFPHNPQRVNLGPFPAVYELYLGEERTESLVASSNFGGLADERQLNWLYTYDPTAENNFRLDSKTFLLNNNIDMGLDFNPAFMDLDGDGLKDMVVGNKLFAIENSATYAYLAYYKNTSTPGNISFELKDNDFLSRKQFGSAQHGYKPTFCDIDNNGFIDLLIGTERGFLLHYESSTPSTEEANFVFKSDSFFHVKVPSRAAPTVYDVDRDGLLDLLIGDKNGNFTFFKNIGTSTAPNFVGNFQLAPNKYKFGKFSTKGAGDTEGDATPGILTINGKDLLVSGSQKGKIFLLSEMNGDTSIALQELDSWSDEIYTGRQNVPVFTDLDNDGFIDLVNGNIRGGMTIFNTTIRTDGSVKTNVLAPRLSINIYPNPTKLNSIINISSNESIRYIDVFDMNGRKILSMRDEKGFISLDLKDIQSSGIYIIRLIDNKGNFNTQKVILIE